VARYLGGGERMQEMGGSRSDGCFRLVVAASVALAFGGCCPPAPRSAGTKQPAPAAVAAGHPATAVSSIATERPAAPVKAHTDTPRKETLRPLLAAFPGLSGKLRFVPLASFPTPVQKLEKLGTKLGGGSLYIKRDDLAGKPNGGSKLRKLELLFGEAKQAGKTKVISFGGLGSNMHLATAVHAPRVGLDAVLLLSPHPVTEQVRYKLLAEHELGAEMRYCKSLGHAASIAQELLEGPEGAGYHVMPPGGTSTLSNIGFVNAAFELKEQIAQGLMPAPDRIYIAAGTMGSAAGLIVGLKAAGLKTMVVAVKTTSSTNYSRLLALVRQTSEMLHGLDPSFPLVQPGFFDLRVDLHHFGFAYGQHTPKSRRAARLMAAHTNIELDLIYTGRAFAALIDDAPALGSQVVLFWNTFDARRLSVDGVSASDLPADFRPFFKGPAMQ